MISSSGGNVCPVKQVADPEQIRVILQTDRYWAAYALGDLEQGYFEHCEWFVAACGATAIVLVYSAFSIPVVLTVGAAPDALLILEELRPRLKKEHNIYFVIRPDILPLLHASYDVKDCRSMLRMALEPEDFTPADISHAVRLDSADLEAVKSLYADGEATGESPEFFLPEMLERGAYFGAREGEDLVAVAGTHVMARGEGVGALGGVYTRRDRRGRGLAACVTTAVTAELLRIRLQAIVLNVRESNSTAIRLYERLGFRPYCQYYEVIATPRNVTPGAQK